VRQQPAARIIGLRWDAVVDSETVVADQVAY